MKTFKTFLYILISSMICFSACKKAEQGPQGPQGEQGPAGPKGDTGPKGDDVDGSGEFNVVYSDWQSVSFTGVGSSWKGTIPVTEITQDILDKADIAVFYKDNSGIVHELNVFNDSFKIMLQVDIGTITINSTIDASNGQFRYVMTPAGVKDTP